MGNTKLLQSFELDIESIFTDKSYIKISKKLVKFWIEIVNPSDIVTAKISGRLSILAKEIQRIINKNG